MTENGSIKQQQQQPQPQRINYVNNKRLSKEVYDYVRSVQEAKMGDDPIPTVPNYIAKAFMLISEGLARRPNFSGYSYKDEMILDAIENCLKAIANYDIEATTRSGSPNAFAYFTQIAYYAFLRRLSKEKRQQDIKDRFREKAGIEDFVTYNEESEDGLDHVMQSANMEFVDTLKDRMDDIRMSGDTAFAVIERELENEMMVDEDLEHEEQFESKNSHHHTLNNSNIA